MNINCIKKEIHFHLICVFMPFSCEILVSYVRSYYAFSVTVLFTILCDGKRERVKWNKVKSR